MDEAAESAELIFKIVPPVLWRSAQQHGVFRGAPVDLQDGYIHFSAADQVAATLARHFGGERDLLLVAVNARALGTALRWEPSRGGALFPHLYAPLPLSAVKWAKPLRADGMDVLPPPFHAASTKKPD